ncbi:YdiK family protein [Lacticigenium naphthae]|uniref:YdiK family protein n=1 Tax=Lacticigenium naphthae TaxID=515351 RepID=UPI0004216C54|nr:YdiK family protein [Lacticigenium naphthae]
MISKQKLLFQIILNFIFFGFFLFYTINSVNQSGWNFFSILFALLATNDFVRVVKLTKIYFQIKKGDKPE